MSILRDSISFVGQVLSGGGGKGPDTAEEQPLRTDLLSLEQLHAHARKLAGWHRVDPTGGPDRLLDRLAENEAIITATHKQVAEAVSRQRRIVSAEDWLLDNYHVIDQQVRMARQHLPRSYSQQLPRLQEGPMAGYPRVYDIAFELISHSDGLIDRENLTRFVEGYQQMTAMTLGELWAVPIMLRLALIENLRRVSARLNWARRQQGLADYWADRIIGMARQQPGRVVIEVAEMAKQEPDLSTAFVPQFIGRLQVQSTGVGQAVTWIEQQLAERGQTIDQIVQYAGQVEAGDQIAFANSITSLRSLGGMNWRRFVDSTSAVEKVLCHDPAASYPGMDFESRDRCRHVIERLARQTRATEIEVAQQAIRLAQAGECDEGPASAERTATDARTRHVAYFLVDDGLPRLQRAVKLRPTWRERLERTRSRGPLVAYLGSSALVAACVTLIVMLQLGGTGMNGLAWWVAAVLVVIGSSSFALTLVNLLVTRLTPPRLLPKLDFSEGIPDEHRTIVAVPTLIDSADTIRRLVDDLEIRFLANRDGNLLISLLTDFPDADRETKEGDQRLLELMRESVERLNRRNGQAGRPVFYWLHRPRLWNECEGLWMAWERKRGKLMQFNRLILHGETAPFSEMVGDLDLLRTVRYVISLDTDTQLPHDSARQMVAAMAHPLNRPVVETATRRVTRGYAILQPRVTNGLEGANSSRYAALMSGEAGVDPYTREVSDVYQDLFGEGTYIGKGIYDVKAFEQALGDRFPENQLLSHDLIESCYARSALISDVQLVEDYPSSYLADMNRRHRWVRGDWQQWRWLLPKAPDAHGRRVRNPIRPLGWWKIFDNLRRSLVPAALLTAVAVGWIWTPSVAVVWSLLLVGLYGFPAVVSAALALVAKPDEASFLRHTQAVMRDSGRSLAQSAVELAVLPFEAYTCLHAALRSAWQMAWTKRGLMVWHPSGEASRTAGRALAGHFRAMWINPVVAILLGLPAILAGGPDPAAGPVLVLWLIAPGLMWWLSQPALPRVSGLNEAHRRFLRRVARLTWRHFEVFVGPETNDLPPDNYQETGDFGLDARTSPTNIGMGLLANLTAMDLGYITGHELIERTRRTFDTMDRLERYRGHFYNWYDSRELATLPPRYVSTVDSGNLAGHLLITEVGLRGLVDAPIVPDRLFEGLADTIAVACSVAEEEDKTAEAGDGASASAAPGRRLRALAERISGIGKATSLTRTHALLEWVVGEAEVLRVAIEAESPPREDLLWWGQAIERQATAARDDLLRLAPYQSMLTEPDRPSLPAKVESMIDRLDQVPTLGQAAREVQTWKRLFNPGLNGSEESSYAESPGMVETGAWLRLLGRAIEEGSDRAAERIGTIERLVERAEEFAQMDFTVLYDEQRQLLRVGINVAEHLPDPSYYDLLASEARLASYVAVAMGQLPQAHWFSLGRSLTISEGHTTLTSWSGSMFEYLMPNLVMPSYEGTLLDVTNRAAVQRQIQYGRQRGVPWGVSESGYAAIDSSGHHQYQAFGVPGLGLKRGLGDDLVVAPYASAIAALVAPTETAENLQRLAGNGALGRYGFYEAIDYTRGRVPHGQNGVPARLYMSHHAGMTFVGVAQALLDRPMHQRFLMHPLLRSARLLLQERVPRGLQRVLPHAVEVRRSEREGTAPPETRVFTTPHTNWPRVNLLSNGRYHVMVSNSGGGYSRWGNYAVTRWREDRTSDKDGQFVYLRDRESGRNWSVPFHPRGVESDRYEATFTSSRAEFRRVDHQILSHMIISVSPEDDVEVRRLALTNHSSKPRRIEVTTYGEIVLADPAEDAAHPAFGKLFVQTELLTARHTILATRRPRQADQAPPWLFHQMQVQGRTVGRTSFETDRSVFLGRGRTPKRPIALWRDQLGDTAGSVLDPIFAIRRVVTIMPDERATIDIITGMAESREAAMEQVLKYCDHHFADRLFDIAPARSQLRLQHLGASESEAQLYGRLAASILHPNPAFRAPPSVLRTNRLGQSALWRYGISGDLPIVLLTTSSIQRIDLVAQTLKAHAYWRFKGLVVDLVIINDDFSGYRQELHDALKSLIVSGPSAPSMDNPGGVFLRRGEQLGAEERTLLQTAARLVLEDTAGDLAEQTYRQGRPPAPVPPFEPTLAPWEQESGGGAERHDLVFYNGYGGFTPDGQEYITSLSHEQATPAPWANVIANDRFGTVVTESGSAYTWFENAHEYRLTPWHNDPVTDHCGEAIYIRDEQTGQYWSPTPLPVRGLPPYATRHGFGYTIFEHEEGGIRSELSTFVAADAPVKFMVVKLRNNSARKRRLSVTAIVEWVLSEHRSEGAMHVVTELDPKTGALFARNRYNTDFPGRVAFLHTSEPTRSVTGDRGEFIGRNRTLANPIAMEHAYLSGRLGAGFDPCGAIMTTVEIAEGSEREVVFMLGAGSDQAEAHTVLSRYRGGNGHRRAIEDVWAMWNRILGAVHVETPDKSVDFLVNGWLIYQTLACRMWGRSGYYQSGGAFGFRDQLQDCMALLHAAPWIYRGHLVYSCEHQFQEGDVQHWWHPPANRGVRTRIRDDYLWLPYAAARYVSATGDTGVLAETRPFLTARPLAPGEESSYDLHAVSEETASVYEHCVRAIEFGLQFGPHGLPIIGSGDWNDGMDRVGPEGRGESVWLAFFLYDVLMRFAPIAEGRDDGAFARRCREEADKLRANIERHAWDGAWYLRAYFDDGRVLGSHLNPECQIDAIPQAWAAMTGAVDPRRVDTAMRAVDKRLIRRDIGIIQLFDPPFDKSDLEPGYIKGYVPGVRENGGQYTHAATWVTMAFATLRDAARAWECFNILNPVRHGGDAEGIATYKVEPYVMAADVYGVAPHEGRGGWTWYTGSGGWTYRVLTETILGLRIEVDTLYFEPCLPEAWDGFRMHYRYRETFYHINVVARPGHSNRVASVTCDGQPCEDLRIRMVDDRANHQAEVMIE